MKQAVKISLILITIGFITFSIPVIDRVYGQQKGAGESIVSKDDQVPEWKTRWELARVLSYTKRYGESITEYRKVLSKKPQLYEAKIEMAKVLYWMGKKEEALHALEDVPIQKLDEQAQAALAEIYITQKRYDKAEVLLRGLIAKNPKDYRARLKLAELLSWDKRYKESIAEYEIILNDLPDDRQVRRKYALVLMQSGRHSDAAAQLRKTLE
ncbi:MAG: Tetratricopeptide repeat protein [Syntrophorhabdus sp. PtaU1.Bin058]|nr:MAG: Tetratricopeptide repeat protein [Syntrophorhabdus sp. PtaU1.Bin058]